MQYWLGAMTGSSADAIDVVLVRVGGVGDLRHIGLSDLEFCAGLSHPMPVELREQILSLTEVGKDELARAGNVSRRLAHLHAKVVTQLLDQAGVSRQLCVGLGLHGQTVRHAPQGDYGFTWQLTDPSTLALLTNIPVIANFRAADIAAGGQGAPLAPAFHEAVFGRNESLCIVNLGGIANLTILAPELLGFDIGPGNALLDAWAHENLGTFYDESGSFAQSGVILDDLLAAMLADSYFAKLPPKSTGRDYFNLVWLSEFLSGNESASDVQATLVALTVHAIRGAILQFAGDVKKIALCGGGVHNCALMDVLAAVNSDLEVVLTDDLGVSSAWMEALCFAWLARLRVLRKRVDLSGVTGASKAVILGGIYGG